MFLTVKIYSRLPPSGHAKTVNYRMVEKKILDRILSPSIYDSQIRPKGETQNLTTSDPDNLDGPTIVWVNLFVRSFEKIDDVRMQFSVQITFRQQWNDNSYSSTRLLPCVCMLCD